MLPRGRSSDAPARNGAAPPAAHGWIGRRRRMQCEPGPLKTRGVLVADLFCGAGGSSSGARRALESLGFQMNLVAVNHWNIAIETHSRNHPEARHYCQDLNAVKPAACARGKARPIDGEPYMHLSLKSTRRQTDQRSRPYGP